ncbi:restriction endonuclease subunit S [Acinetobacter nosocomialis]|uniref:restriction endonuclease subunit S n=1 Tax=Acinetobacter nosocomialis TaxID=106654 RepID=UPI00124DE201|nr:restriction endonuclease subunit S [Acinetobacter nosocomialis]
MSVPKLRFKEFDGEWHQSSLGQLTNYFKGYAFKSESYKERGVRIIRVSDLGLDSIKYDNDAIFLDETESSDYENWMLKKHDIIITTVGSKPHLIDSAVGRPIYIKNNYEGLLNQNLLVLRPINNEIEPYFIFSQLLDNKYLTHIETIQRGNANQSNITVKDLQEFKVFSTAKTEQTKIASFLSAVDEKIKQLTQKHELLSQYKQGMMQKLFSQQIRFKADDGSEFGEWEEKELKDVANLTSSKRVHLADYVSKGIPFFRGKEITELKSGGFPSDILYISPTQFNEFKEKFGAPKNGEILITAVGTLANTYLINTNYEFYFKDGNLIWLKDIKSNPNFLMILLDAHKNDVLASAIGSTQKALTIANLNKLIFKFPTLEEQTKISNFLSAIDQKIEVVAKQIEQTKQWKKGLLQQMFV